MPKNVVRKMAVALAASDDMNGSRIIAIENDRFVRPKEAVFITGRSLASQHRDKLAGNWVPTYRLGSNSVAFKLSDLLALNASREIVTADNTKAVAVPNEGKCRGRKPNTPMCSKTENSQVR